MDLEFFSNVSQEFSSSPSIQTSNENDTIFGQYPATPSNQSSDGNSTLFSQYPTTSSNQSSDGNSTLFSQYPAALMDAGAFCCIIFAIVGVLGNLITILALAKSPRLRNATTAFVVNLCFADLLFCSFSLPLSAVMFHEREWKYSETMCRLFALFRYSNGAVSIFSVIAITVNRYVRIVHPKKYASIYKPVSLGIMIVVIWISSFVLLSFPLFDVWGKLGYDPKVGTCTILRLNGKSPKTFIYICAFALPSIVFIICYSRIYWVVKKASQNLRATEAAGLSRTTQPKEASGPQLCRRYQWEMTETPIIKRDKKETKILKVVLVIFITYILCYFPVAFVKVFSREEDLPVLNILGYLLVYLSSCINPIIYVGMSKEYRQAYIQFFTCRYTNSKR